MNLFSGLSVSLSGMSAQRVRAQLLVENIANSETTRTPEGGPYRRKEAIFTTSPAESPFAGIFESSLAAQAAGVSVAGIVADPREPDRRYAPGHPDADAEGYVAFPRSNAAEDMVDLMGASRAYQANISAVSAIKDMIQKSIEMLRY
jgi:flagellar basal-body rod protein FlgC